MLAPRKTAWKTPAKEVVPILNLWLEKILEEREDQKWRSSSSDLVICDVGCGDGSLLLEWAKNVPEKAGSVKFVGVEIDVERAEQAKRSAKEVELPPRVTMEIHCINGLESKHIVKESDIIFLALIPRGMRLIYPMLEDIAKDHTTHVMSYMNPLVKEKPLIKTGVELSHQPGAQWPLYLYRLDKRDEKEAADEPIGDTQ